MAFKPSKRKKHNIDRAQAKLTLNSMMDIFIIILLFLLKTYSAQGHLIFHSTKLDLPVSSVVNQSDVGLKLVVTQDMIFVEKKPIVRMQNVIKNSDGVVKNGIILPLKKVLLNFGTKSRQLEEKYGIKFSGDISISADKNLDYEDLVKIIQTCGNADYPNMHLSAYNK
ncbi:MAG: hypothetical protein DWQ05_03215 [Calditrichaeota bacterium]|nr:MAG: hypothetical protein DWQ05_03215 [Calditrichota bacterium]